MKKTVIEELVTEARRVMKMKPMETPLGLKKAHVVYYNSMIAQGVTRDDAQNIMKQASKPMERAVAGVLMTTGIMRDALHVLKEV